MGKASTRTGFLVLNGKVFHFKQPQQVGKMSLKVIQDWNSQNMKSNNEEFATYSIFTLFIFPLQANMTIPRNELYAADCMSQANGKFMVSHSCPIPWQAHLAACIFWANWKRRSCHEQSLASPWEKKTEFKLGCPWTMAWVLPISREKGFGYFLFCSKKIYSQSSYNKCWVRVINPSKPTSH